MSNLNKLEGELAFIDAFSTYSIHPENHYIISIKSETTTLAPLAKKFLKTLGPIGVYHYRNTLLLLFLSGEETPLQGNYCKITSYVCSKCVLELQIPCEVNIVQFETKNRLLTYFLNEVRKNISISYQEISEGHINATETNTLTEGELKEKLKGLGINWKGVLPSQKFGILYTLDGEEIKKTSIRPSSTNFDTYKTLLFG